MVTTCARGLARPLIGSLLVALTIASCGGPSLPGEAAPSSPLSPSAPSAPLPTLGASFDDPPLTEAEQAPMDHSAHGAPAPSDEEEAAPGEEEAEPDEGEAQGHGHAH